MSYCITISAKGILELNTRINTFLANDPQMEVTALSIYALDGFINATIIYK